MKQMFIFCVHFAHVFKPKKLPINLGLLTDILLVEELMQEKEEGQVYFKFPKNVRLKTVERWLAGADGEG